jgi:hypothetical protein
MKMIVCVYVKWMIEYSYFDKWEYINSLSNTIPFQAILIHHINCFS